MAAMRCVYGIVVTALLFATAAMAQQYPAKPIRMIVPLPPGTASDLLARAVGRSMSELYQQQIVIDNRPGAGGLIGSTLLTKERPNGYTLALVAAPHLAAPLLQREPPYRPLEDVTPIIELASIPNVIIVAPTLPVKTLPELIALVKANPGRYNYASFGIGTVGFLSAEILNGASGMKAVHVPFKDLGNINAEMVAGRVHYFVPTTTSAQTLFRGNVGVRGIAVTSAKRSAMLPDLPTVAEVGLPAAESDGWFGIVAPAGLPGKIVAKLNADIAKILHEPDTKEKFARLDAAFVDDTTPQGFERVMKSEYSRYRKLIKDAAIPLQ